MESIINQTFRDIEIICINDGSTDNSLDILEDYSKMDDRIHIISQKNKGLGAARNVGLEHAKGDYIYFIDSDDYLELNALNELYSIAQDNNVDLIIFKLLNFMDDTRETFLMDYHEMSSLDCVKNKVFRFDEYLEMLLDLDVTVYTKFFKKELISSIRFDENLIFEDNLFASEYIFKTNSIYFYDKHLYHRRVRKESIIHSHSKNHVDCIEVVNGVICNIKKNGYYDDLKEILFEIKIEKIFNRYMAILPEFAEYFFNAMKKDFNNYHEYYEKEIDFTKIDPKLRSVFNNVVKSKDYNEFNLYEIFDLNKQIINLKIENEHLKEIKAKYGTVNWYNTARIDIKNHGTQDNSIEIIHNSDESSSERFPDWFKDKNGEGLVVQSQKNSLDLTVKAINNGKLQIKLRGIDVRDRNNERFPIYIDYTSFCVNGVEQLSHNMLTHHDDYFLFEKEVKDSEIIKIKLKWLPFNSSSHYSNEVKILSDENRKLNKKYNSLKVENSNLKLENKKINDEMKMLISSNSWKITKPLRKLKNLK